MEQLISQQWYFKLNTIFFIPGYRPGFEIRSKCLVFGCEDGHLQRLSLLLCISITEQLSGVVQVPRRCPGQLSGVVQVPRRCPGQLSGVVQVPRRCPGQLSGVVQVPGRCPGQLSGVVQKLAYWVSSSAFPRVLLRRLSACTRVPHREGKPMGGFLYLTPTRVF